MKTTHKSQPPFPGEVPFGFPRGRFEGLGIQYTICAHNNRRCIKFLYVIISSQKDLYFNYGGKTINNQTIILRYPFLLPKLTTLRLFPKRRDRI